MELLGFTVKFEKYALGKGLTIMKAQYDAVFLLGKEQMKFWNIVSYFIFTLFFMLRILISISISILCQLLIMSKLYSMNFINFLLWVKREYDLIQNYCSLLSWKFKVSTTDFQPWESAAAFGSAVVNAVLCWFYDGKKCHRKGFHICGLSFQVLQCFIILERFDLVYN